jgi:hypothetical protein
MDYLDLEFDPDRQLKNYNKVELSRADPTGTHVYDTISMDPLTKWERVLSPFSLKAATHRWLSDIDKEDLQVCGYDKTELLASLEGLRHNVKRSPYPVFGLAVGYLALHFQLYFNIRERGKSKNRDRLLYY